MFAKVCKKTGIERTRCDRKARKIQLCRRNNKEDIFGRALGISQESASSESNKC